MIFDKKLVESSLSDLDIDNMTEKEEWWKNKIMAILVNKSGKYGPYHHGKYAKRLKNFILKIVPPSVDRYFTAAVDSENGVIYVGKGLLTSEEKIYQLNVVIRHELAHVLLAHEIRMLHKMGEEKYRKLKHSSSIHDLLNIIMDFEISNRKYSSEDKKIMKKLWIAGKEIECLVTDMDRPDWTELSVEEMYDKLKEEMTKVEDDLAKSDFGDKSKLHWTPTGTALEHKDLITRELVNKASVYKNLTAPSTIWQPIDEYIAKSKQFSKISPHWQEMIKQIYADMKDKPEAEIKDTLNKVVASKILDEFNIGSTELDSPEDKFWATQILKTMLGNCREKPSKVTVKKEEHTKAYRDAYNEIIKQCGSRKKCSDAELDDILNKVNGKVDY